MMCKEKCRVVCTLVALSLVLVVGCRRGDNRQAIHGAVTMDGKSLTDGLINFRPAPGVDGGTSGASIGEDGEFSIPAAKGLVPGKYLVTVQVWRDTNETYVTEDGRTEKVRAPLRYKEQGKLQVEVVPGSNKFDFNLTSGK